MTVEPLSLGFVDIMDITYDFAGINGALPLSQVSRSMHSLFEQIIPRLIPMHFRSSSLNPWVLPKEQYQQLAMIETRHDLIYPERSVQFKNPFSSVQITAAGTKIIWGLWNGSMKVWDPMARDHTQTLQDEDQIFLTCVQMNREGTRAISGSFNGAIKIWDSDRRVCIGRLEGHTLAVCSLLIDRGGERIISGSQDGTIKIWDPLTEVCLKTLNHGGPVEEIQMNEGGTKIISRSTHDSKIWDVATGECTRRIDYGVLTPGSVQMNAEGTRIFVGDSLGNIKIWDTATGEALNTLECHEGMVTCMYLNTDATKLVSGSTDRTIKIWDLNSGKCKTWQGLEEGIRSVYMNKNETEVIAILINGTIKVWNIKPLPEEILSEVARAYIQRNPQAERCFHRLPSFVQEEIKFQNVEEGKCEDEGTSLACVHIATSLHCYIAKHFLPHIAELFKKDTESAKKRLRGLPTPIQKAVAKVFCEHLRSQGGAAAVVSDLREAAILAIEVVAQNPRQFIQD